jgi:AcrR family transcriptional regulator
MDEIKRKILLGTIKLYGQYGIKSLTMDDVAHELGMSKKTLYQYVNDKDDLVNQVVKMHLHDEELKCKQVFECANNPIGEIIEVMKMQYKNHGKINSSALFDLKKYHPESFNEFLSFKERIIKPFLIKNIKRGIIIEIYHDDLDVECTAQIYMHLLDFSSKPDLVGFGSIAKMMSELMKYHLYSITSTKGRKILSKELEKFNIEIQQVI